MRVNIKFNYLDVFKIFIFFAVYFFTARLGLTLDAVSGFATLVWLPSGISLATLLIFGFKFWPGIFAGAFLANLLAGAPYFSALGIGIGNTLEALLAAYFLKNFVHFRNSLDRLKDVLGLTIIAAILSTMVSATIGVLSLWLGGKVSPSALIPTWTAWWVGDMISDLVVAPAILVYSSITKVRITLKATVEAFSITLLSLVIYFAVFRGYIGPSVSPKPSAYMIFPPLIWTALRFGVPGAVTITFILSVLVTLSTLQGIGLFVTDSPSNNLLSLQFFMTITSVTTLILAAVVAERKEVTKTKDEFIAVASHELKTPLTTIRGYTQLLQQTLSGKPEKKALIFVAKIITQVDNMTRLISDFFDVSKIQTGKLELQKEIFDMDKLVEEVAADMIRANTKHKIKLSGSLKKQVFADRYRISQVLINLLSNAVKFSPKKAEIKVFLHSDSKLITISVQDFGIGIAGKDLGKVFERFFQADTRIRQSEAGLGLGLYISSEIIRRHKGRITVKSEKGQGSTFSLSLPVTSQNE